MSNDTLTKVGQRHNTYTLEFKQQLVMESLEPGASVSIVARRYDLNANVVFEWRRRYRLGKLGLPAPTIASTRARLLPVEVIDTPGDASATDITSRATPVQAPAATQPCCEVEIEVGKRRVRIRGLPLERAEQFLHDCLR